MATAAGEGRRGEPDPWARLLALQRTTRAYAQFGQPLAGLSATALGLWATLAIVLRRLPGGWSWLLVFSTPFAALLFVLAGRRSTQRLGRVAPEREVVHARRLRNMNVLLDVFICAMPFGRLVEAWGWFALGGAVRWATLTAGAGVALSFAGLYAWRFVRGGLATSGLRLVLIAYLMDGGMAPWRSKGDATSLILLVASVFLGVMGLLDHRACRRMERELEQAAVHASGTTP